MTSENEKILAEAQKLYNEGKWREAFTLLQGYQTDFLEAEDIAESCRLAGWSLYYMATKGPVEEKRNLIELSSTMFSLALSRTSDTKKKTSILNGLPLSLWILEEREEAWGVSDQAMEEFPDESSVLNTRSILCRWAKKFEESVKICERVYETALAENDYRTAGHGKHNRADALKELGRTEEAKNDYAVAVGLYEQFEVATGQSAQFHIEGVKKKLLILN